MTTHALQRASELRSLAMKMLQTAIEIENDISAESPENIRYLHNWGESHEEVLLLKATEMYSARRRRKKFLCDDLFGEPAWDILLDLYVSKLRKRKVSVKSACIAADVPNTTALRWISKLEELGLVEREFAKADRRVNYITLTVQGANLMSRLIHDILEIKTNPTHSADHYLIKTNK